MIDQVVESLKRLYENEKINEDTLNSLLGKGIITQSDKEYVIGKGGE